MYSKFFTLIVAVVLQLQVYCQIVVTTIAGPNSSIDDALAMDQFGTLYGSHFGNPSSGVGTVYKIEPNGNISEFSTGYSACNGLAFGHDGQLYVVDFAVNVANSQIYKLDSLGNKSIYGPKIPGASGIIFDPMSDTLFVSQYTSSQGNQISKLSSDGNVSLYCGASELNGPVGMAFDNDHNLYVANFNNGKIFKVLLNGDSLAFIADVPHTTNWGVGFMTFASGYLYATGIGVHKIFRISLEGEVIAIAGTGTPGTTDGAGDVAQFNRPNGIITNAEQDKLYVSDYATKSVREISGILDITSIGNLESNDNIKQLNCFPNPCDTYTTISYKLDADCNTDLQVFTSNGKPIQILVSSKEKCGVQKHAFYTGELASGIYIGKLNCNGISQSIKILVSH
jgi:sugar lactone lactonase YvrE